MKKSYQILERIINSNIYEFLKSHSTENIKKECADARLSLEQEEFLLKMHALSKNIKQDDFQILLKTKYADIFPLVFNEVTNSSEQDLFSYLKNKKVALIGPSISLIGSKQAEVIESFDCVVRINFQWPVPEELAQDIGRRMDILYHCCNGDFPITKILVEQFKEVKFACFERNIDSNLLIRGCKDKGVKCLDVTNQYQELSKLLKSAPNTGTVAISHLLKAEISELYITGLSFFKEDYYPGYQASAAKLQFKSLKRIGEHKFAPQIDFCKNLIKNDKRVKYDFTLKKVLGL